MAEWYEAYPEVDAAPAPAPAVAPTPTAPATMGAPAVTTAATQSTPVAPAVASVQATPAAASAPALSASSPAGNWWEQYPEVGAAPAAAAPAVPATTAATPAPQRTALESVAHGVGVGVRGLVEGAASLPAMVTDNLIAKPVNAALDLYDEKRAPTTSELITGKQQGFRVQPLEQATDNLLTGAGVAQAENSTERVMQDINRGAGSAVAGVATGTALTQAAGPITRALGAGLSAAPGAQVASGAASGAASGITRESGGGAVAQTIAGVAGALAPTVVPFAAQAGVRGAIRGGEAGRQNVADNIATFQDATGTLPTVGQAVQSRGLQAAETGLSNVVGSSGVMIRKGEQQAAALQDSVNKLSTSLAPNATATDAGEAISKGVNAFRDNVRDTQQRLYNNLDRFIAPDAPITVGNTRAAMQELNAGIDGAENLSTWFRNSKLSSLESSLVADLEKAAQAQAPVGWRSSLMNAAPPNLDTATLPYESIKKMRTLVGREMSDANFTSEINRDKWAKLYGALSEDLGTTAKAAGPQAEQAWSRANTFTRLASERMEQISSIVNKDAPEHIFRAATSGLADGGTQINRVMKSMPVENRREVAAAVLQRLGRARNGAQDELGSAFSSETFLTNLAALSPPARAALFGNLKVDGLQQKVQQLGRVAAVRRDGSAVFANPSGTARQAGMIGWAASLGTALASGNTSAIVGALAAPLVTNGLARAVTNERVVRSLAKNTELSGAAAPAAIAALIRPNDDTTRPGLRRMREGRAALLSGER